MKESELIRRIKRWCDDNGVYYIRNVGGLFCRRGIPDFVMCLNGIFVGIECKVKGRRLTKIQSIEMSRIVESGGKAYVVNDFEQFLRIMEKFIDIDEVEEEEYDKV